MSRYVSAEEAVSVIKSGSRVFLHSVAAAPRRLIEAMHTAYERRPAKSFRRGAAPPHRGDDRPRA